MNLNLKLSKNKNKNKLIRKINFFQNSMNYDDIMFYSDNLSHDNYDEIILNDDIFINIDDKFNENFYENDTLFY